MTRINSFRFWVLFTSIVCSLVLSMSCSEETNWVDPEVTFSTSQGGQGTQPVSLILGIYQEQFFLPLEDYDETPVAAQSQGGQWVTPAIVTTGFDAAVIISATITMRESGEVVGSAPASIYTLRLSAEGSLDFDHIPVRVEHVDKETPNTDLFGEEADLVIEVNDELGHSAKVQVIVVLVEG
jgi:hypothetical protein